MGREKCFPWITRSKRKYFLRLKFVVPFFISVITIKYSYLTLPYAIFSVERFKERLNIKIVKKVNGSDDGVDDKSALLSDYKYDNSTSKECNDIMKGMERSPVTGNYTPLISTFMLV